MDLDKWWQLIKSPMLYLDWCVLKDKERGLSRKPASAFNFICHGDFLVKVSTSYQICNHRNEKLHLTNMGLFSSIVFRQQFLILLFWKFEKSKNILRIPCSIIWFNKSNVVKTLAYHYILRHSDFSLSRVPFYFKIKSWSLGTV